MLVGWKFEWRNFLSLQSRFDHIERRHCVSTYVLNSDVMVAPAIAATALSARERCTSLALSRCDMRTDMKKSGEAPNYLPRYILGTPFGTPSALALEPTGIFFRWRYIAWSITQLAVSCSRTRGAISERHKLRTQGGRRFCSARHPQMRQTRIRK